MGQTMNSVAAIILAAGKGTRMKSTIPKVLHRCCGLPMVEWVLRSLQEADVKQNCLVLGDDYERFNDVLEQYPATRIAIQLNRNGTGDAVAACAETFKAATVPHFAAGKHQHGQFIESEFVLVCTADIPAVGAGEYGQFIKASLDAKADIAVLGMDTPSPHGYGRMVLQGSDLKEIVEERDADLATKKITICNTGILFFRTQKLFELLCHLTTANSQGEYYLTDCIRLAKTKGLRAFGFVSENYEMFQGINDRIQLAGVENFMRQKLIEQHMQSGVSFHLPQTSLVEANVEIGQDTVIGAGFNAQGRTRIGKNCRIGSNVILVDANIGDNVAVGNHCEIVRKNIPSNEKIYSGSILGLA